MMNNTKMTNVKALEMAIKVLSEDNQYNEVVEKLQKMLETANKKVTSRKPTATQAEMMKKIPELANLSNQRVTSLVTALYSKDHPENRVVERAMDKRKAVFFIPEDEENAEENAE